jgi:hypothetical protein
MATAQKEKDALQTTLNEKQTEYQLAIDNYNSASGDAKDLMSLQTQQYQMERQATQDQMTKAGFMMDLMSYQTPAQKEEAAWNTFIRQQDYVTGNINSKDPATRARAISNAVDGVLKEFD